MLCGVDQLRLDRSQDGAELAAVRDVRRDGREPIERRPGQTAVQPRSSRPATTPALLRAWVTGICNPASSQGIAEGTELGKSLHRPGQARGIVEGRMRVQAFHHDARQRGHGLDEVGRLAHVNPEATQTALDLHIHGGGSWSRCSDTARAVSRL